MKNRFFALLILAFCIMILCIVSVANAEKIEAHYYNGKSEATASVEIQMNDKYIYGYLPDGSIVILLYIGNEDIVDIRYDFPNETVTSINDFAFGYYSIKIHRKEYSNVLGGRELKQIILPDTITYLGNSWACKDANWDYYRQVTINLPSGLKYAAYGSLYGMKIEYVPPESEIYFADYSLWSIKGDTVAIDESYEAIRKGWLAGGDIKHLILPSNLKVIEDDAVSWLDMLESIELPESLESIGSRCFIFSSDKLAKLELPDGLKEIGDSSINSPNLTVLLPASVNKIGEDSLQVPKIIFGEGRVKFDFDCFKGRLSLKNIELPSTTKIICKNCFSETGLESLIIPNGTEKIENNAFKYCDYLKTVSLPASLLEIGENAFLECPADCVFTVTAGSYAEKWVKEMGYEYVSVYPVEEIIVSENNLIIQKGKTAEISITILPDDATNKEVEWVSTDSNIATVNNGKIKAVACGECDIVCIAKDGFNVKTFCHVSVIQMIQNIQSKEKKITIPYGGTYEPNVIYKPEDASNKDIAWNSSDEGVVHVNSSGVFEAVGSGDCEVVGITMDGSNKSMKINVHVPVFDMAASEWKVEQPDWFLIPVDLHGLSPEVITKKAANNKFFLSYFDEKGIHVYPISSGTADITLTSQLNKADVSKFKVTVNDSAVKKSESESAPLEAVIVVNNPYPGYSDKIEVDYYISGGKQPYQLANLSYSQALLHCIDVPQTSQFSGPVSVDIKKFPIGSVSVRSYGNGGIAGKTVLTVVDAEGNTVRAYANRVYPMKLGLSIVKDYWAIKRDQPINEIFKIENGTGTYNGDLWWTETVNGAWKQKSTKQKLGDLLETEYSPGYCESVMYSFEIKDAKDKRLSAYTGENWIKMTDDVEGYITTEESYYQHVGDEIVVTVHCSKDIEVESATWDLISADDKEDFEYIVEHREMALEKKDENTWEARFIVEPCDYVRFNMKLTDSYLFRRDFRVVR